MKTGSRVFEMPVNIDKFVSRNKQSYIPKNYQEPCMKLEYLDNISEDGKYTDVVADQLVRLFDFDQSEAGKFRDRIKLVLIEQKRALDLQDLDFIKLINCKLVMRISDTNLGIVKHNKTDFTCDLTSASYEQMLELLQPFCENDTNGFQWLYDLDTPVEFLFSPGGSW